MNLLNPNHAPQLEVPEEPVVYMRRPLFDRKSVSAGVLGLLGVILFIVFVFPPFTIVSAGHRGVAVLFGAVQDQVYGEGLHWKNPLMSVVAMDVRTQILQAEADSASKDLQSVTATIAVNYRIDTADVQTLYQEVGLDYEMTVIAPAIQESVKAATAQFTAEELITKRPEVRAAIHANLENRLDDRSLIIEDVSIVNFQFSDQFDAAIEAKQTAEQQALKAANDLRRIELEAQQTVVRAQAEAESIRIQSQALTTSNSLINLEAVRRWDGELPVYYSGDTLPFFTTSTPSLTTQISGE